MTKDAFSVIVNQTDGSMIAQNCEYNKGRDANEFLIISIEIADIETYPNWLNLKVEHSGHLLHPDRITFGRIMVNGKMFIDKYIAGYHMDEPDTFAIPKTYLQKGKNEIAFGITPDSKGNWRLKSIKAFSFDEKISEPSIFSKLANMSLTKYALITSLLGNIATIGSFIASLA